MPLIPVSDLVRGDYIKINGGFVDHPILKQRLHNTWTFFSSASNYSSGYDSSGLIMISNYKPIYNGWSALTRSNMTISCSSIIMQVPPNAMIEIEHRFLSKIRRTLTQYDDK